MALTRVNLQAGSLTTEQTDVLDQLNYNATTGVLMVTASEGIQTKDIHRWEAADLAVPGADWPVTTPAEYLTDPLDESIGLANLLSSASSYALGMLGINVPAWATTLTLSVDFRHAGSETAKLVDLKAYGRLAPSAAWGSEVDTTGLTPPNDTSWAAEDVTLTLAALGWTAGSTYDLALVRKAGAPDTSGEDCYIRAISLEFG